MPYHWLPPSGDEVQLHLWPHRSLPRRGFVWFIGLTAALGTVPLIGTLGSPVLWFVLPFAGIALTAMWIALQKSYRDGDILEALRLTPSEMTLTRHGPGDRWQEWRTNPHWARLHLHEVGGPVPNYLTLQGGGREVELGAFLSEEERISLFRDLQAKIRLRSGDQNPSEGF